MRSFLSAVLMSLAFTSAVSASEFSAADTLLTLPDFVVVGENGGVSNPADVTFTAAALAAVAPLSAADLEPLLPASVINVNSRGESLLMIRGAPERHVSVALDGIPLVIPWDERADLSLVPLVGASSVQTRRGPVSLLDGPNGVAGSLQLHTDDPYAPRAVVGLQAAEVEDYEARASWRGQRGGWSLLAAASHRDREALALPADLDAPFHQDDPDRRTNTDLRQSSLLLKAEHPVAEGGRLSLLLLGADAEKGVAPETHLDTAARLWRMPKVRRGLLGGTLELPLAPTWHLEAMLAIDAYAQDIRPYESDDFADAPLATGDELEQGRDLTSHARLRLERALSHGGDLSLQVQSRYGIHDERLVVDGPELRYAQWLGSAVAQLSLPFGELWTLDAGAGADWSTTPRTGDKPARDALVRPTALLRLGRELNRTTRAHLAYSHRSRFPALRELYSGALGRFVPNGDLEPETQDLLEAGLSFQSHGWEGGLTGFASRVADGIEKESLGDGRFTRVNRSRIHSRGVEAVFARRFGRHLNLSLHHTVLHIRADDGEGTSERAAEDRPAHLGSVLLSLEPTTGWRVEVVGHWLGRRASADATDTGDGLRALPSASWWDAWLVHTFDQGREAEWELRIGVRNAGDHVVFEQVGLPAAGRTWVTGATWRLY